jgi:2-dehydro-3-deoxyphosphogluconate aldolase/(4S)-4-hydroxy-2-oxoglutarate aldolase
MPSPERKAVLKRIIQSGIVPVFYHDDPEICKNVVKACYEAGIRVFEFAGIGSRSQEIYNMLGKLIQRDLPEMYFGIGNITDAEMAEAYANYNVDFIVCPTVDAEVGALCKEKKILWIPGCSTPSEIAQAKKSGASFIKLFPGEVLGPSFIRSVREIFPELRFMPTGGVEPSAASIIPWMEAGATAVNLGSRLITPEMLALNDFTYLKAHLKKLLKTIRQWRQQSIA